MVRQRYREYDLNMGEKTVVEDVCSEVPESPIGFYLFDMVDEQNYPLKDGWHCDIQDNDEILTYFYVYYDDGKITIDSEYDDLVFVNNTPCAEFNKFITDTGIIEIRGNDGTEKFVISTEQKITIEQAKKTIGRFLVLNSDSARDKRISELRDKCAQYEKESDLLMSFLSEKIELEKSLEGLPEKIESLQNEIEKLTHIMVEKKVFLETKFREIDVKNAQEKLEVSKSKIAEVNKEIEIFTKK